jgi:D-glycero-D-manno-heptose 1,7-bisphosphate phosphatase
VGIGGRETLSRDLAVPPTRPAVFLDRDGTLNAAVVRDGSPFSPSSLAEFRLLPGVAASCRELHEAGFVLVVATNQPDVGRGTTESSLVDAMHAQLRAWIPEIARIEVCPAPGRGIDHPENRRRKPEPGMILDAAGALGLDLARSWMVGDRWRDIECGRRAGLRTVFLDLGYREELRSRPDFTAPDLPAAARIILANRSR